MKRILAAIYIELSIVLCKATGRPFLLDDKQLHVPAPGLSVSQQINCPLVPTIALHVVKRVAQEGNEATPAIRDSTSADNPEQSPETARPSPVSSEDGRDDDAATVSISVSAPPSSITSGEPSPPSNSSDAEACATCKKGGENRIYHLPNGLYCGPCLEDGTRDAENPENRCGNGSEQPNVDGRPLICIGKGANPGSRACLATCNALVTLSRSENPCNENTLNAGNRCSGCIEAGDRTVVLGQIEGGRSGHVGSILNSLASCNPSASQPGYTPPASRSTASSSHSPASPSLTKPSFSSRVEGEKHEPQTSSASNSQRGNMPTADLSAFFVSSTSASSTSALPTPASSTSAFRVKRHTQTSHVTLNNDTQTSITGQWRSTSVRVSSTVMASVVPPTQPSLDTGKGSTFVVSSSSRAFADAAPAYIGLSGTATPKTTRQKKTLSISASMFVAWLASSMLFSSRYTGL